VTNYIDIKAEILAVRKKSVLNHGFEQGLKIPVSREVPLVPLPEKQILICEIKRSSPSSGTIGYIEDPVRQAGLYIDGGADVISVLTEKQYFKGSLEDLIKVKNQYPGQAVLRKDFLYCLEDIEISWRAGADLVLLIASLLEKERIIQMYKRTKELGMEALVEVHDKEDIEKIIDLRPNLVGINSRNLSNFSIDLTLPLKIKQDITWNPQLIFESGIKYSEDAEFALCSGFDGILVGESVVKNPNLVFDLSQTMLKEKACNFWERLYSEKKKRPLIKICGLTLNEDVKKADKLGADILGFILAESPRQADISFIRNLPQTRALKAGVVVLKSPGQKLQESVEKLMIENKLDVIQFHGNEDPGECSSMAFPYYKAVRLSSSEDVQKIDLYRSPRVLIDAYSKSSYGGTGKQIDKDLISAVKKKHTLWLAGGISPDNVRDLILEFNPELIDVSSCLEKSPGIKDHKKMEQLFKVVNQHTEMAGRKQACLGTTSLLLGYASLPARLCISGRFNEI
jgi:indole-3-glycerol phosphate synthase / phosphoribosylanthranilate isomerase